MPHGFYQRRLWKWKSGWITSLYLRCTCGSSNGFCSEWSTTSSEAPEAVCQSKNGGDKRWKVSGRKEGVKSEEMYLSRVRINGEDILKKLAICNEREGWREEGRLEVNAALSAQRWGEGMWENIWCCFSCASIILKYLEICQYSVSHCQEQNAILITENFIFLS